MFSGSVARGSRQLLSQMNDHHRVVGRLARGTKPGLCSSFRPLIIKQKTPSAENSTEGVFIGVCPNYFLMPNSCSVFNISMVVFITVSELSEMLLMPHSTRNLANSG